MPSGVPCKPMIIKSNIISGKKYSCLLRISFPAIERIIKMATKFNMAAKNHVTPQNSLLRTPNLNLGSKSQNGLQIQHGHQKSCDTSKFTV